MANLSSDISNKANGMATDFKNTVLNGEHQLQKMAQGAGERVGTMASNFANSTANSVESGREYVRENPIKGVAMAAAAGMVFGSLLTAVMRSRRD
jgi:ElaB/YqjD/DUF883 family membrane-anchored ribosome-binding protein